MTAEGDCSSQVEKARMENYPLTSNGFLQYNGLTGADYLGFVAKKVSEYKGKNHMLPCHSMLTIAPVEDTEYRDHAAVVNAWSKFYLPTTMTMQVFGYVEKTLYPCDQLVLMTCEDQKVYGYDGDELHLVAKDLKQLLAKGITYPPSKSHYHGEALKDMTEEDWKRVKESPVGKRLDEEHRKLVASCKSSILESLRISRQRQKCHQPCSSSLHSNIPSQLQKGGT